MFMLAVRGGEGAGHIRSAFGDMSTGLVRTVCRSGTSSALSGVTRTPGSDKIRMGADARPGLEAEEPRWAHYEKRRPFRWLSRPDPAVTY